MRKSQKNTSKLNKTKKKQSKLLSYTEWCKKHHTIFKHFTIHNIKKSLKGLKSILNHESKEQIDMLEKRVKEKIKIQNQKMNVEEATQLLFHFSQIKSMDEYKKLFNTCTKGMTFRMSTHENDKCFDVDDTRLKDEGAFGQVFELNNDPKKVVKIQEIRTKSFLNEPISVKELCTDLKKIELEVENMKLASKLGVSPKIYDHVICMDYINSTFHSCIVMQNGGITVQKWLETNTLTKKDKDQLKKLLKTLHNNHILHGDIHNGNILVDDKRRFYFIDYGLSTNDKVIYKEEMERFEKMLKHKNLLNTYRSSSNEMTRMEKMALQLFILQK